jgi:maltose O-acetyltransferase
MDMSMDSFGPKLMRTAQNELRYVHPKSLLVKTFLAAIPRQGGGRIRSELLRRAGADIGKGTSIWGDLRISGDGDFWSRLRVGERCIINVGLTLELGASITVEDEVSLGHEVMILTTTHNLGPAEHRAGPSRSEPVRICRGAWIGSRAMILPGVTVGPGAVVAAGAIVNRDVEPNTIVAGTPARVVVPKLP